MRERQRSEDTGGNRGERGVLSEGSGEMCLMMGPKKVGTIGMHE